MGRALAVGIVCAPLISALLLGLGRAGRALHHLARRLTRRPAVTYHYTDPDGHEIEAAPDTDWNHQPVVTLWARGEYATVPVRIPVDRVEELVAGIRDTARQAATGSQP